MTSQELCFSTDGLISKSKNNYSVRGINIKWFTDYLANYEQCRPTIVSSQTSIHLIVAMHGSILDPPLLGLLVIIGSILTIFQIHQTCFILLSLFTILITIMHPIKI